jgi:hypothetical protein
MSFRTARYALCLALPLAAAGIHGAFAQTSEGAKPAYDDSGKLVRPRGYRSWVAVASSLGVSYNENVQRSGPGSFQNIYIEPAAYRAYRETGKFPEGTMLALAVHEARNSSSEETLAKDGFYQGNMLRLEIAVKNSARYEVGWAYYDFGGPAAGYKETAEPVSSDNCYACHVKHAAVDNVFVQFYPVLRDPPTDE